MTLASTLQRVGTLVVVSTLIGLAMLPLASTQWAEQQKQDMAERRERRRAEREKAIAEGKVPEQRPEPSALERYAMPFVKVGVAMAVPGTIVLVIVGIGRRVRRAKREP